MTPPDDPLLALAERIDRAIQEIVMATWDAPPYVQPTIAPHTQELSRIAAALRARASTEKQ